MTQGENMTQGEKQHQQPAAVYTKRIVEEIGDRLGGLRYHNRTSGTSV
jgi:hypothetical protein